MRLSAAIGGVVLLWVATSDIASARMSHLIPPPPPPPPGCSRACSGPPPPPTLVPTPEPTLVAPQPVVAVKLITPRIRQGHVEHVSVEASTDDVVTVQVNYRRGKAAVWHRKVGHTGKVVRTWKIPKKAPVGLGTIRVTVAGSAGKVQRVVPFVVTH